MCLSIPGKVLEINYDGQIKMGKVDFSGIGKGVCLQYLPDVKVGDYVLVHAGFAISTINEEEAARTMDLFKQMGEALDKMEGGESPSNI